MNQNTKFYLELFLDTVEEDETVKGADAKRCLGKLIPYELDVAHKNKEVLQN